MARTIRNRKLRQQATAERRIRQTRRAMKAAA